jgi:hypothetical protein
MLIDCDRCPVRGTACSECLVSALVDRPPDLAGLAAEERYAIELFLRAGFEVEVLDRPAPAPVRRASRRRRAA